MATVIINNVEYIEKPKDIKPPENIHNATHWAVLPDDSILFYRVDDEVVLWQPLSQLWIPPSTVPYTLHSYDDYST
ncbi:MAG: hypothetical protein COA94_04930 [Rickettsiales bacterium]|nr:MAG: hypothetical protein COA94_04930 [Rickettsiales bacterium]